MFIEDFSTNFDEGKMSKLKLRQKVADVFQTADLVMGERPTVDLYNKGNSVIPFTKFTKS